MSARTHERPESKPNDTLHPLSGGGDAAGPDLELKSTQAQAAGVCVCVRERVRESMCGDRPNRLDLARPNDMRGG